MRKLVPVFPWPMHPKVAEVINAIPDITVVEAQAGGPRPALVVGSKRPPFVGDFIVVTKPEHIPAGVAIVVSDGIELVTMAQALSTMLDPVGRRTAVERAEVAEVRIG